MAERDVPEHVKAPEYWELHGPRDVCAWGSYSNQTEVDPEKHDRDYLYTNLAWPYIADFLHGNVSVALAEFGQGTIFDGTQYQSGTIIRESFESALVNESGIFAYVQSFGYAVYIEASGQAVPQDRMLVYFGKDPLKSPLFADTRTPEIEVGKVIHTRVKGIIDLGGRVPGAYHEEQDISRVTKVEVLTTGLGNPKRSEGQVQGSPILHFDFAA